MCVRARAPGRMVTDHLKANLHFARLDGMEKGPVEFQALAAMLHPLAQVALCPLLLTMPALILWAELSMPPSLGLIK